MPTWNYEIFLQETLSQLREEFKVNGREQEFQMWFNIQYVEAQDSCIIVSLPSNFLKDQFLNRGYMRLVLDKLHELSGQDISMDFIIKPYSPRPSQSSGQNYSQQQRIFPQPQQHPIQTSRPSYAPPVHNEYTQPVQREYVPPVQETYNPPIQQQYISPDQQVKPIKEKSVQKITVEHNFFNEHPQMHTPIEKKEKVVRQHHPSLRRDYTFDTFVLGDNNSFAYNAARAIAKNPGHAYNPMLIYGGVGLGKTHLMEAIGNDIFSVTSNKKIIYITAENFTNEFIDSINEKTTQKFKNKYRTTDVLLIDDIHFLQNKIQTQEELFHIFNALYDSYKQIVFTCDRPVSELKNLTDRLRSRFERGLNVDLQPPKYETRRAIIEKKLESLNQHISNDVIDLIAQNVVTNVRDLEACLTKLIAYTELVGNTVTLEIAQQQLRDTFSAPKQENINVDNIQRVIANYFNISIADLKGKKKTKNITFPRQIAMYIARELTEYSTTELGVEFGGRDHTTVMHSCRKIEEKLRSDSTLEATMQILIRKVKDFKK